MRATIQLGTSGWSYKDWVGPFYDEGTKASDYLPAYAETFSVVEVDSSFYGVPRKKTVASWAEKTPDTFRFALKVPGAVTHGSDDQRPNLDRVLRDEDGVLPQFLDVLEPLETKLATIVFQFPYFRVKEFDAADFLDRLGAVLPLVPREVRVSVEIRNKTWIKQPYLALLRQHRAAAVLIDHPYMPPPLAQVDLGMVTTDFCYIRLLGDRYAIEKKTKQWGEIVEDKSRRIHEWAEAIRALAAHEGIDDVYAFANNHFAGHAPSTLRELRSEIESEPF